MRIRYIQLFPYIARQWRKFAMIGVATASASGLAALEPLPLKLLVDTALGGSTPPEFLARLLQVVTLQPTPAVLICTAALATFGFFVLNTVVDASLSWAWMSAGQRMVYDLSAVLFHKLQRLSLAFHVRRPIGDSLGRLVQDTWSIYSLTSGLMSPCQAALTMLSIGFVAYRLDPGLTMLSFGAAPVLAAVAVFFGPKIKRRARASREVESRLVSFVHQTLEAIPVVQAFGTAFRNRQAFHSLADDAVTLSQRSALLGGIYNLLTGFLITIGSALVLYVGGGKVLAGTMSPGTLLVFLVYMTTLQSTIGTLLQSFGNLKPVEASVDRVVEILDSEDKITESADAVKLKKRSAGHICIEDVRYGYEPERAVLNDVTLTVYPGETIVLAGSSGAGKSTLVSLIPRFFDPWSGRVTLDGLDVRDIQISSLREQVGVVFQEPFLLPLTIAENIAFGRPAATRAEIESAAEAANAHDFIRRLPAGYETILGQRGTTLSGGERQRLSIARALLKDAPILILDEPTSALDSANEAEVLEAVERLMAGRTTLIVAHRLSVARKADRIVMLDNGRVVEVGRHRELLAASGLYHGLYTLQMTGPLEASA